MADYRPLKRRRVTPPLERENDSENFLPSDLLNHAAHWELEQDYERRPRSQGKTKESKRLPIKTAEGQLQRVDASLNAEDQSDSFLESESSIDGLEKEDTPPTDAVDEPTIPLRQQINSVKEELARLASLLNEDPEENAGCFKKLAEIGDQAAHPVLQRLAIATQLAVYEDLIPGYRIRSYKDEDLGVKVSKDVRKTRQYEHALIVGYQSYVNCLTSLTKSRNYSENVSSLRITAINCVCSLLLAVPHFNFRTELLNILVHELASLEATSEFSKCIETLENFFVGDDDGAPSLEAVRLLTKMMKARDYQIREEVLYTFFQLRLLSELPTSDPTNGDEEANDKIKFRGKRIKKEQRQHRSKKERKLGKERKVVEKDMKEANATVNLEERERMQSDTLKLVFAAYFRILKAKIPTLMGVVLEGLAKYAHLINQDYFGDILEALKDIVSQAEFARNQELLQEEQNFSETTEEEYVRNKTREILLSTQTAFTLLSEQEVAKSASTLHLDLSFFASHIYQSLYNLSLDSDIELGPKSLRLPDPHSPKIPSINNKVNVSTPALLVVRVLTAILLAPTQKPTTIRVASFYKRLLTALLQIPEKSTLAILDVMAKVAEKHGRKIEPLWYSDERKGDGVYRGESESIEGSNVFAVGSGVWENELLKHHYCPSIRERAISIDKIISGLAR